ncbi:MAG: hypothetical protein LQ348_003539 [Seirophora lacunosa]|nr:MAG: hypothetical protein LQ348_003539 [Seirophora lacunosa]
MAEKGLLICMPAGKADLVDRVRPYCTGVYDLFLSSGIGRGVIDFSNEAHGKASLLKVIGNVFIVNMIETVAEGLVLAEQSKLGMDNLHKFIQAIFPGPFALYSQRMISGDYYKREEPDVSIDMARHLAGEVLALAAASGTKLKAYEAGYKHMEMVQSHAGEKGDISGIYGAVRQESGLAYENSEGGNDSTLIEKKMTPLLLASERALIMKLDSFKRATGVVPPIFSSLQSSMALTAQDPMYPIVALGVYRHVAASMDPLFLGTPFRMTAIMDTMQEPKSVRYNPQNMAVVLFNLHPRPKVFITGAAISRQMTHESIHVWNTYVQESKEKNTFVINLCDDPPPHGDWANHILRRLREHYGTKAMSGDV